MSGTMSMFKFPLEASLFPSWLSREARGSFKCLNLGKRIKVKNSLLPSEPLQCQDSLLCLQVEEGINK